MRQLIEIVGDFIYATDDSGKTFVVHKSRYTAPILVENFGDDFVLMDARSINSRYDIIARAKKYCYVGQKHIISHGEFVDVKCALRMHNIYIENDEIIPRSIFDLIVPGNQISIFGVTFGNGVALNNKFTIPISEWKEPTKIYSIITRGDHILINGNEFCINDIKRLLREYYYSSSEIIFTKTYVRNGKNIFSGGFLLNLMNKNMLLNTYQ